MPLEMYRIMLIDCFSICVGDGITHDVVKEILKAVLDEGYSAQTVCFGLGGGLLQKVSRDDLNMAVKLNHVIERDGKERDVLKAPKTDSSKCSLPGRLDVIRENGILAVYPASEVDPSKSELQVIYDNGPVDVKWEDFDTLRARVAKQWEQCPKLHNPISATLKAKIDKLTQ